MEIFGGLMVMLSILGFFVIVAWLMLPFVVFSMKGKIDRMTDLLEDMDKRLKTLERRGSSETSEVRQVSEEANNTTPLGT